MEANPSSIQRGDSGGPLLITRSGRTFLIGVNWNSGGASGGSAAAVYDIDGEGHWNPAGSLIERIIYPGATVREGVYEVRAVHSDKCLDVPRSSRDDGSNIIQFNCTNATNQQWRLVQKAGYYWAVSEYKLLEYSAVLWGASEMTPTQEVGKNIQPSGDTGKKESQKSTHEVKPNKLRLI